MAFEERDPGFSQKSYVDPYRDRHVDRLHGKLYEHTFSDHYESISDWAEESKLNTALAFTTSPIWGTALLVDEVIKGVLLFSLLPVALAGDGLHKLKAHHKKNNTSHHSFFHHKDKAQTTGEPVASHASSNLPIP